jgi:methionyl-tRNA formyltransferase
MKRILILGCDRIARQALRDLPELEDLLVVVDRSVSLKRIVKLVLKGRLNPSLVVKMFICECSRSKGSVSLEHLPSIRSNQDLLRLIESARPTHVFLFRAGLIINESVIALGLPLMNIHCADVPEYGGLGSIHRAMKDGSLSQNATLHEVTASIDNGRVLDKEPYLLDLKLSYCANENNAYEAGIRLLIRALTSK